MTKSDPCFVYQAEMGFTHYELIKGLPSAIKPYVLREVTPLVREMHLESRFVRMSIEPEVVRKIASIELPVTHMKLEFFDFTESQYQFFMDRFKRYLHRGGG